MPPSGLNGDHLKRRSPPGSGSATVEDTHQRCVANFISRAALEAFRKQPKVAPEGRRDGTIELEALEPRQKPSFDERSDVDATCKLESLFEASVERHEERKDRSGIPREPKGRGRWFGG
jgi:hypothetical protein